MLVWILFEQHLTILLALWASTVLSAINTHCTTHVEITHTQSQFVKSSTWQRHQHGIKTQHCISIVTYSFNQVTSVAVFHPSNKLTMRNGIFLHSVHIYNLNDVSVVPLTWKFRSRRYLIIEQYLANRQHISWVESASTCHVFGYWFWCQRDDEHRVSFGHLRPSSLPITHAQIKSNEITFMQMILVFMHTTR